MTPEEFLAESRRIEEAATPGPWIVNPADVGQTRTEDLSASVSSSSYLRDAEFIAHARTALPKMREALEAVLDYCASIPEPYYPDGRPESSTYRAGAYDTALEIVGRIESALGGSDD